MPLIENIGNTRSGNWSWVIIMGEILVLSQRFFKFHVLLK